MLNLSSKPKKQPFLRFRKIGGKDMLIDRYDAYELSETSCEILKLADGNHTIAEIIDEMEKLYDVERETLERDCLDYLSRLSSDGLIEMK